MGKCILITGASGFLGRHICDKLSSSDYEVIELSSISGCISEPETLRSIKKVDVVIHLAGILSVEDSWSDPQRYNQINVNGTLNVLELCRKFDAEIIFCSSYVYGVPIELPINENHKIIPTNPYMLSKITAENMCRLYNRQYGVRCKIIRPFNVYGLGQSEKLLLGNIIAQIKKSYSVEIRNVKTSRDFVHIDDLASAFKLAINYQSDFEIFNIGSGYSISVAEIIDIIKELTHQKVKVKETNKDYNDPIVDCYADITNARLKLKWEPTIDLKEGLAELLEGEFCSEKICTN